MADTLFTRTPRAELPEEFHPAWDTLNRLTDEPTFVEVFASAPDALRFVMNDFYARQFFGGQVDNRYKQLARLKLSLEHGCRTCNRQNVPGALEAGFTQAQVDALEDYESGPFTPAEKAVLRYVDQVKLTNVNGTMSPALFRDLRQHFSEAEILELGTVMAIVSGMAKLSFVLDLVEKEAYCPFVPVAASLADAVPST